MDNIENDMDDLFQKAGDLYPLKTGNSDWDSVAAKLEYGNAEDTSVFPLNENTVSPKNRRKWLLILIPLIISSYLLFTNRSSPKIPSSKQVNKSDKIIEPVKVDDNLSQSLQKTGLSNSSTSQLQTAPDNYSKPVSAARQEKSADLTYPVSKTSLESNIENVQLEKEEIDRFNEGHNLKSLSLVPVIKISTPEVHDPGMIKQVSSTNFAADSSKTKSPNKNKTTNKGFYTGFLIGPDLSTVHLQQVNNTGFTVGIVAGYQINRRFSLETGFYWDKKYYYSTGDYFKPNKALPSYITISKLNGNCNMFELPITVKYDFAIRKSHHFFARAGMTSYFMKKEYYNFEGYSYQWGTSNYFNGDTTYHNTPGTIFSIVHISAGYERDIGKNMNIRIEPYIKIPVSGIGYGNLPISSAGLLLGIRYSFK